MDKKFFENEHLTTEFLSRVSSHSIKTPTTKELDAYFLFYCESDSIRLLGVAHLPNITLF